MGDGAYKLPVRADSAAQSTQEAGETITVPLEERLAASRFRRIGER